MTWYDVIYSHPDSKAFIRYRVAHEDDIVHHIHAAAGTYEKSSTTLLQHAQVPQQGAVKRMLVCARDDLHAR